MTTEHELINRFFAPLCSKADDAPAFGLLDDTALITTRSNQDLLLTKDALVAGVHFFADDPPEDIAWKALAVNVSDIVSKGGKPTDYLMSLAIPPKLDESWIARFADGIKKAQTRFGCELIGGDTVYTPGPMMISITLLGVADPLVGMVRRKGAAPGDTIFVSGTIGDAALGLLLRLKDEKITGTGINDKLKSHLFDRYLRPRPHLELASQLARFASAAMDISDGLLGDLEKLCAVSKVGATLHTHRLPLSDAAKRALASNPQLLETVLSGGDDYEVLATIPSEHAEEFAVKSRNMRAIGEIRAGEGVKLLSADGEPLEVIQKAYDHFDDAGA